jgi:hypothetical protein
VCGGGGGREGGAGGGGGGHVAPCLLRLLDLGHKGVLQGFHHRGGGEV